MIDGVASRPFSAKTIPPPKAPEENYKDVLIENSRRIYSTPRSAVEEKIAEEWSVTGSEFAKDRSLRKDEHRLSEILKPVEDKSVDMNGQLGEKIERKPRHFDRPEKKKVDINDLKKALQKSLGKDFGDKEEIKEDYKPEENII